MKQTMYLIVAIIITATSSCSSTFYYSILDTKDQQTEKVENGDFLIETDSLWIAYCFKGESAPIQITVFNKTDKPLYVDWGKSALIVNDLAVSYAGRNVDFNIHREEITSGSSYSSGYRNHSSSFYTVNKEDIGMNVKLPPEVGFIPPKTMISESTLNIQIGLDNLNKQDYKKQIMGDKNNNAHKIKRARFTEENTPLKFKSYLTVYSEPDKPMSFEQEFYISNIIRTNAIKPKNLTEELADRGDWFYIEKPANNSFVNILLGTTIVAGAVILDASLNNEDHY